MSEEKEQKSLDKRLEEIRMKAAVGVEFKEEEIGDDEILQQTRKKIKRLRSRV